MANVQDIDLGDFGGGGGSVPTPTDNGWGWGTVSKGWDFLGKASEVYQSYESVGAKNDSIANETRRLNLLADKQAFDRLQSNADNNSGFNIDFKDKKTLMIIGGGIIGLVLLLK